MRAAVVGPGKMGSAVAAVWQARGHEVALTLGRGDDPAAAQGCDVAFELTRPEAAAANVEALLRAGVPTVCGTTGWDPAEANRLARELAVPLLVAANFSIGVAVLRHLAAEAARRLAPFAEFEPGIVERHHAAKVDSPSGTARMLAATVGDERGGRQPPVAALRHGGQPGEHQVIFEGAQECLELTHRVRSREVFALGAVAAGEWLARQHPPGPVTFDDFLRQAAARPQATGEEMPWTAS
jgi:4-hydroxy-tetrahydrodipicolinate reductase